MPLFLEFIKLIYRPNDETISIIKKSTDLYKAESKFER